MADKQLPPLPTLLHTRVVDGIPCISVSEHEHLMRIYALQAIQQAESGHARLPGVLKDHQIADMVNSLRDIALQFHGHGSLRERIANVLVPALKAEAKTGDPVYQICRADSVSISTAWVNVQKQQYEDAALYPEYVRRVLYTHPAPGVTDDVSRDAERYRWLRAYYHNSEDIGICKWVDEGWSGQWVLEHDPDTSIDAAMLAASLAQKGD